MKHINPDGIDPATEPVEDKMHRLARILLSSIPAYGSLAAETFATLVTAPTEKRKLQWCLDVTKTLNELIDREYVTMEQLQNNDRFMSALLHASQIAIRNHNQEKLEALKNATINSISEDFLDESMAHIFINLVDTFTPLHLKVLRIIDENSETTFSGEIDIEHLPGMIEIPDPLKKIIHSELNDKGLVECVKNENSWTTWKTTTMGSDFLKFIMTSDISNKHDQ